MLYYLQAGVAEMADAQDLGSCGATCKGSNPFARTTKKLCSTRECTLCAFVFYGHQGALLHGVFVLAAGNTQGMIPGRVDAGFNATGPE